MNELRTINQYPAGSLLNPAFQYKRSCETDVRETFARVATQPDWRASQPGNSDPAAPLLALDGPARLIHGEALQALQTLPPGSVDAVICDPPYSSGGFSRDDKNKSPDNKYTQHERRGRFPDFTGDNRDQRSYLAWCAMWVDACLRALKPGGYFLAFTDWRQLPVMTDAIQCGGVFWRGIVVWDKGGGARAPHKGYFKHQCEYIAWGTKGAARILEHDGPFPGCINATVLQSDKFHMTGKPTALMRELVRCVEPGGVVLDPFAGSGSTGVACLQTGRRFIGIEREAAYIEIARSRLQEAASEGAHATRQGCLLDVLEQKEGAEGCQK